MNSIWTDLHRKYDNQDWLDAPSMFAETAIRYFPQKGKILDLGAGQGQDSRFFAINDYEVISTDLEPEVLEKSRRKLTEELKSKIKLQRVDLREELPFEAKSFDVVYAHLSLHYFSKEQTLRLFNELSRVLKPGGVLAFLVNSVNDPQYKTGETLENDYFRIGDMAKRFFSLTATREFTKYFEVCLLDDLGETYKDRAKGVHNLIRFIGKKSLETRRAVPIPFVGAIIEQDNCGEIEVLMQTRWKHDADPIYTGTLEFPAGKLDVPYESVYDALAREVEEECGLKVKTIVGDDRQEVLSPRKDDAVLGFRPFCCVQQLRNGKPWVGFIFICRTEGGSPTAQLSEAKDVRWVKVAEIRRIYDETPEKLFSLEVPAWKYYLEIHNT